MRNNGTSCKRSRLRQPSIAHLPLDKNVSRLEWELILRYMDGVWKRDQKLLRQAAKSFDSNDVNRNLLSAYIIALLQIAVLEELGRDLSIGNFYQLGEKIYEEWLGITGQDLNKLVEVLTFSFGDGDPPDETFSSLGIIYQAIAIALLRRDLRAAQALCPRLSSYIAENQAEFNGLL